MIRKIKRLIDWFPVIWKDYDWDYHSLYVIMRKKLSRMEPAIRSGYSVDSGKDANRIHYAVMLLDRLIACDYLERALLPVHREWGEIGDMRTRVCENGLEEWLGNEWEKADTEEERLLAEEAFRKAGRRSDEQELADKDKLFEHISKYILGWWD